MPLSTPLVVHHDAQRAALERVMAIAEFTPEGVLKHANPNYLRLFGYDAENAAGLPHQRFCTDAYAQSSEYAAFWRHLRDGLSHSGPVERVRHDGASCWLEATYTPVLDEAGKVLQILKIATDITERFHAERARQQHMERLALVADASDSAVIISDAASAIVYVNAGFSRMFGWRVEEVVGLRPIPLLSRSKDEATERIYQEALRGGHSLEGEELVHGKDGQRYWAKIISNPVSDAQGCWQLTVTILTDITRAKMYEVLQQRALEAMARERPLGEVLEGICEEVERIAPEVTASILEVDAHGRLRPLAAPNLPRALSTQLDGVEIGPCVGSCGTAAWRNEAVRADDIASDPLWQDYSHLVLPLGYRGCWSTPVRNSQGRVIGTFAFYFSKTGSPSSVTFHQQLVEACTHLCALAMEREQGRQRIRQLAFYDSLTGLPNRRLTQAKAEQAITAANRDGTQLAVLFIDLDRFKQVNDSLGHPAGDELLQQSAKRLAGLMGPSDTLGRQSGDEFVVVLSGRDAVSANDAVRRIQAVLSEPFCVAGTTLSITCSVGIAMYPASARDMDTLLQQADIAMYQAKKRGRGSLSFFSAEMDQLAQERLMLEGALRLAIQSGQLHLQYQPQVALESGELYGVEALARWTHPVLGTISPARFIPLAEECGLIADLGLWAIREACRQLSAWRAKGLAVPAISVNLSPTSFHNLALPQMVADTLRLHRLDAKDLTLELTENILLDTNPYTMKTISALSEQGIRLSMDDFGTGYSSLSYLRRLPVSELKLDQSFVADLEQDPAARALSNAILGIGQSLRLTVVAEGVETDGQTRILRAQGYPVAQGYLFSRPLSPQDMETWMTSALPTTDGTANGGAGPPPAGT